MNNIANAIKDPKEQITARIPISTVEKIINIAERENRSRTYIINRLLENALMLEEE